MNVDECMKEMRARNDNCLNWRHYFSMPIWYYRSFATFLSRVRFVAHVLRRAVYVGGENGLLAYITSEAHSCADFAWWLTRPKLWYEIHLWNNTFSSSNSQTAFWLQVPLHICPITFLNVLFVHECLIV